MRSVGAVPGRPNMVCFVELSQKFEEVGEEQTQAREREQTGAATSAKSKQKIIELQGGWLRFHISE